VLVSEVFEAIATIDVDCTATRERAATVCTTECGKFRRCFKPDVACSTMGSNSWPNDHDRHPCRHGHQAAASLPP